MKKLNILIILIIMPLFALVGCSKDKSTQNTDVQDEAFTEARTDADSSIAEFADDNQECGDWIQWGEGPLVLDDSVGFDTLTFWHFYLMERSNDWLNVSVADSFRFADMSGEYQRRRDSTTNQFERRLKRSAVKTAHPDSQGSSWTKIRNRNMVWVGLADTVTTLNGEVYRFYHGESQWREFSREFDGEFIETKFYTEDIFNGRPTHPFEGTLVGTIIVDKERPNGNLHIEAQLTVTFYPDHYHAILQSGNSYREWDHYYRP